MAYREIILAKTSEYVKIKKLSASGHGAIVMIDCPYCETIKSAQFIRALGKIRCIHCQRSYNLLDLVRLVEDRETDDDETILNYLRDFLKIDVQTVQDSINLEQQLKIYQDRNWALVPCAKAANIGMAGERPMTGKEVIQPEWQKKENRDPADWYHWISSGLNIGVRTGSVSNLTIIDFDLLTKQEKAELVKPTTSDKRKAEIVAKKAIPDDLKAILGDTLMQESLGGFHCFYTYCSELRKTAFNHAGFHIDVENDGGQVIIPPSLRIGVDEEFEVNGDIKKRIVGYAGRAFINSSPIIPIPGSFLEWIKSKIDPQTKIEPEAISTSDIPAEFQIDDNFKVKDIQGNRNNTLISLGGIFRKELNSKQVHYVLRVLNKHVLESPLANGEIDHIMDGINKYCSTDADTLAIDIVNYLRDTDTASKTEIESAVFGGRTTSENKKRLDRTLMRLIQDEKIIKKNAREYRILKDMVWTTDLLNGGLPLNFKVPYFSDYASFNWGDNILVGGVQKVGKCLTNGYLATNQGLIDIADMGNNRPVGESLITEHIRVCSGLPKEKVFRNPSGFYKQKVNKTIKITSYFGYELEGTPEHPIKICDSNNNIIYKELQDIKIGDRAVMMCPQMFKLKDIKKGRPLSLKYSTAKVINLPDKITPVVAKLMGYIIGDGSLLKNQIRIYQNVKDVEVINDIINLYKSIGLDCIIKKINNYVSISVCSAKFYKWIKVKLFETKSNKILNITSPNRFIPSSILKSDKDCQIAFISALFNCESNLNFKKVGNISLEICMSSEKLMKTLHVLLLNFGIVARLTSRKIKTYPDNIYWRILLSSEMTKKFYEIFEPIKYHNINFKYNPRRSSNIKWIGNNQYKKSKLFEDTIESITINNDEKIVYDLSMESDFFKKKNQFWSNGFISHNTHLSMNFLKRIAQQGIIPRYLYSENGGRHNKIALQLGLKPGDVEMTRCSNPADIIMRKQHSVYIYDWYRPRDFTRVGDDFELMAEKLDRSQSIMITLTQLREGNAKMNNQNDWFAKDQIRQYVAMSAKYIYEDKEGVNTFFDCNDIRESKTGQKMFKIPCKYNKASKEVQLREEVEQEERLKQITETPLLPEVQPEPEEEKPKTIDEVKFDPQEVNEDVIFCDDCHKFHSGECTTDVDGSPLTEPSETQTPVPTEESEEYEIKLDPGDR